jgi:transcriptional regulator with XRE-family HTH domain
MSELKHRLSEIMEEHGYTANRLANEIGKQASTITRIQNGSSQSSVHTLELIANIFGVSRAWLQTGVGSKFDNMQGAGGNNTINGNLVKAELMQRLEVVHFKGNIFLRTPFNKYLLLVPVLDEIEQEELIINPDKQLDLETLSRYPVSMSTPTSGDFLGFNIRPDDQLNKLLNWDILEKEVLFVGREIKKKLWFKQYFFHRHKLYIIIHKRGLLIREIVSQPNSEAKFKLRSFSQDNEKIEEVSLHDCHKLYSVIFVCHSM